MESENKNELAVINADILISDADKYGTDITKMSDFFDLCVESKANELLDKSKFEVLKSFSLADVSAVKDAVDYIDSLSNKKIEFVADLDKLPDKIKDKLKKGIDVIKKSKQVKDEYRPVVLNEDSEIQKEILLKKVVRTTANDDAFRNVATLQKLKQIDAKLNQLIELAGYQIDLQRNALVYKPFCLAREEILNAQNTNNLEDKRKYTEKATEYLKECLAGLQSNIKTAKDRFIAQDEWFIKIPMISDMYIKHMTNDMVAYNKLVGLQLYLLMTLGKETEYKTLTNQYANSMDTFFNKNIENKKVPLALLIHDTCHYNKNNLNAWFNMRQDYIDKTEKELYYISMEDKKNE